MKTKVFNRAIYWEALCQLKIVGIIYLLAVEFSAAFNCGFYALGNYPVESRFVNFIHANVMLLPFVVLFAVIMTFLLFQFQNKRHDSDFYYSLFPTRTSLYVSFMAAILSWLTVGILLSTLTTVIGFSLFSAHYPLAISSVPGMLLCLFGSAFYISGIIAFAMSVTGTVFSNVLVSVLIFAMPPLLEAVFKGSLEAGLPILAFEYMPSLFSNDPITLLCSRIFGFNSITDYVCIGLYSLIVGLLFMITALFLFRRRSSETAGRPALSRPLQAAFRIAFAMLICLIPCRYILELFGTANYVSAGKDVFTICLMYFVALAGFFLYELLTTQKLKNLPRAIPSLVILAALNLAFIFGAYGVRQEVLNTTPAPEEIQSVSFLACDGCSGIATHLNQNYYNTPITNAAIDRIVSNRLVAQITPIKNKERYQSYWSLDDGYSGYIVKIQLSGRTLYRQLRFTDSDMTSIIKSIGHNS